MILHLGLVKNPDNYLKREFEWLAETNINLKRDTDMVYPKIMLKEIAGVNFHHVAYAHIPELGRYYFVNGVEVVHNKIYVLELECDVLQSFYPDILQAKATYYRNVKQGDYITSDIDLSEQKTITTLGSGVELGSEQTLILSTIGGRK